MKLNKKLASIGLTVAMVASMGVNAFASNTLEYKGVYATPSLVANFQWSIFGSDSATAKTTFSSANNGYRVATRLERWDDKNTMADYKYDSDSSVAQCNYTWTDVYAFISRHSIDNSTSTTEYAVTTITEKE